MEFFYWKKFAESGNVFDYLEYKQAEKRKRQIQYDNHINYHIKRSID